MQLSPHAWIALLTAVGVVGALATNRMPADVAMLAALLVLFATGVLDTREALAGFANEANLSVALLFIVAAGVYRSGALGMLVRPLLGRATGARWALTRMTVPVAAMSGVLNNTPMVAMLMPLVADWGRRCGVSPSKLLIPLSYATVLGGMFTMIGTSTNLVVSGLLVQAGHGAPGLFWPFAVAVPVVAVGLAVMVLLAPRMLPDRVPAGGDAFGDHRAYTTAFVVEPGGPLDGRPLRLLRSDDRGLMPVEIQRGGDILPAPDAEFVLHGGDRLLMAGPAAAILAARRQPGLAPDAGLTEDSSGDQRRRLFEVVVSDRCPLVGQAIGAGAFRARYAAAIVAIARRGERVAARAEDWVLRPGDTLLVEGRAAFGRDPAHVHDFWIATEHEATAEPPRWQAGATLIVVVAMCATAALGVCSMLWAALGAALALLALRVLSVPAARAALDMSVLVSIACSLALGHALEKTGAAAGIAQGLVGLGGSEPWMALTLIYIATAICTECISNNAAAALLLPIALATAGKLGVSWQPFALAVMFAASASFATPIGYQTNLMVWGPGGYRFTDFLKLGGLLQIVVGAVTIAAILALHPFRG